MTPSACFGLMCHLHKTCVLYAALEGSDNREQKRIAMCGPTLPRYTPIPLDDFRKIVLEAK